MDIRGKVVIITGGGNGIGAAMARRFASDHAALVLVSDRDVAAAAGVVASIVAHGGQARAMHADVSREDDVRALVDHAVAEFGRVDLFCSNAGVIVEGGPEVPDPGWELSWSVNVMAHVYAVRAALPGMLERGEGYFLNTCSSAGILTALGAAPYAVTKHAAVAFSEWLAITYRGRGIRVSALCPQAVRTQMLEQAAGGGAAKAVASAGLVLEPDAVADQVRSAIAAERFLILTHEEISTFALRKAADPERWINGMRRFAAASR
jgi:NAD(P)-dependent dehydrogenase (short-subunit alcohol dehydrogenase family)